MGWWKCDDEITRIKLLDFEPNCKTCRNIMRGYGMIICCDDDANSEEVLLSSCEYYTELKDDETWGQEREDLL